jgi:hypothetical protein
MTTTTTATSLRWEPTPAQDAADLAAYFATLAALARLAADLRRLRDTLAIDAEHAAFYARHHPEAAPALQHVAHLAGQSLADLLGYLREDCDIDLTGGAS